MEKGFNSDVMYRGLQYHVQTEDWGKENPYLVSRIFQNGAVVKSVKTPYSEVLPRLRFRDMNAFREVITAAMRDQHGKMVSALMGGELL